MIQIAKHDEAAECHQQKVENGPIDHHGRVDVDNGSQNNHDGERERPIALTALATNPTKTAVSWMRTSRIFIPPTSRLKLSGRSLLARQILYG
jgi:hypothetical protein